MVIVKTLIKIAVIYMLFDLVMNNLEVNNDSTKN